MTQAFEQTLAYGQMAESRISRWLRSRGSHVLPVYDKEFDDGKKEGPRFFTSFAADVAAHRLIAPDMLVFGKQILWVEAKHKTRFSWHGKSRRFVTGIDCKCWEHYKSVADLSHLPVWLMFLHSCAVTWPKDIEKWGAPALCPTGLYGGWIADLSVQYSHIDKRWGRSGMIYWAADGLKKLAELSDVPD
jgi:hypothetical protein